PKREGESYAILGGAQTIEDGAFSASSSLKSIDVPDGVETIGTSAFSECVALESISFPGSVRTAGDFAFSFCPSLKTIDVAEDSANYRSIDGVLYSKDGTTLIRYPEGKENEEFVVPDNVASIAHGAFSYCSRLKSVVISEGVDKIEWSAFEGCAALESIVIPTSVKTIESNAFGGCYTLTIRSAEGSVAQEHAKQAGLKFEPINEGAEANGNEEKDDVKKGGVHIVLVDATDLTPDVPGWKPLANVEKALYGFSNEFSGVPLLSNFQINMPASHCGELGGADVASFDVFKGSDARPINVLERCQELSGASGSDDAFFVFIAASASLRRSFNAVAVANALRSNNPRLIVVLTDFYSNTAKNYEGLRPKTETRKYVPEFLPKNDSYLKRFLTEAKGEVLVDSQTEPGLPPLIEISEGAGHFVGSRFEAAFARFAANGCYLESELTPKGFCTLINWEFSREILNYNSWGFGDARRQELTLYEDLGRQQTRLEKKELRTLDSLWRADAARFARLKKSGEFLENDGKLKFDMTTETFFSASK
ncbi:MAG: leucine-rich repeat domain-containing protein, partial [Thermoguttaceae bacterium]|nr:leucine-rich repeat domain-containing protein [Thermoguttaceae bacterium]